MQHADDQARFVIDHELELRELYKAYDLGMSATFDQATRKQAWKDAQTVELKPRDPCKPSDDGCFVNITVAQLVGYFTELDQKAKNFKGAPEDLETFLFSRYITDYNLTPAEGVAAINIWNENNEKSKSTKYPRLEWNGTTKQFKILYLNQVEYSVLKPNDRFVASTAVQKNADQKILAQGKVTFNEGLKSRDEVIWALIEQNEVKLDGTPVSGLARLNQNLSYQSKFYLEIKQEIAMGPYAGFDWQKSELKKGTLPTQAAQSNTKVFPSSAGVGMPNVKTSVCRKHEIKDFQLKQSNSSIVDSTYYSCEFILSGDYLKLLGWEYNGSSWFHLVTQSSSEFSDLDDFIYEYKKRLESFTCRYEIKKCHLLENETIFRIDNITFCDQKKSHCDAKRTHEIFKTMDVCK